MKGLAGAGAIIATSQLPAWGEDKPEVFPERGKFERLSLSYAVVNIGLEKPFNILHISDSHLSAAYPYESEKKQNVSYVVHTGDLIDWQSDANFDISFQSQVINGVNFITLDDVYGYVTAKQVKKFKMQQEDPVTRDFIAYLKEEPLLKCILAGHEHITVEDQFSPTCRQYVTAGGFLFHGREVIFI